MARDHDSGTRNFAENSSLSKAKREMQEIQPKHVDKSVPLDRTVLPIRVSLEQEASILQCLHEI